MSGSLGLVQGGGECVPAEFAQYVVYVLGQGGFEGACVPLSYGSGKATALLTHRIHRGSASGSVGATQMLSSLPGSGGGRLCVTADRVPAAAQVTSTIVDRSMAMAPPSSRLCRGRGARALRLPRQLASLGTGVGTQQAGHAQLEDHTSHRVRGHQLSRCPLRIDRRATPRRRSGVCLTHTAPPEHRGPGCLHCLSWGRTSRFGRCGVAAGE